MEKLTRDEINDRREQFELIGRELLWVKDRMESKDVVEFYNEQHQEEFAKTVDTFLNKTVEELQQHKIEGNALTNYGISDTKTLLDFLELLANLCYTEAKTLHESSVDKYNNLIEK